MSSKQVKQTEAIEGLQAELNAAKAKLQELQDLRISGGHKS